MNGKTITHHGCVKQHKMSGIGDSMAGGVLKNGLTRPMTFKDRDSAISCGKCVAATNSLYSS